MAQILDIDDPLWGTFALRAHLFGQPLEGFHHCRTPIVREAKFPEPDNLHLSDILEWIDDADRPGKVYLEHSFSRKGKFPSTVHIVTSHFYFTDPNVCFEFRMVWI